MIQFIIVRTEDDIQKSDFNEIIKLINNCIKIKNVNHTFSEINIQNVVNAIKKQSFEDLSIHMISMNLLTQCLFFPYSIHFKLYPLITVNSILITCDLLIIYFYFRKRNADPEFLKDSLLDNAQP